MDATEIKYFIEAALLAAGRPLTIDQIRGLFDGRMAPEKAEIRRAIEALNEDYEERGIIVVEVASGFRMQVKASISDRLQKLWEERPPRYSRALFETLALIAYRQPITRGEIEEVRGVAVSSNIVRQLLERDWIRVVGHRDVPGRPAMFATTKAFLDYFSLKKLDDLPPLADLSDWESLRVQLNLPDVEDYPDADLEEAAEAAAGELAPVELDDDEDEIVGHAKPAEPDGDEDEIAAHAELAEADGDQDEIVAHAENEPLAARGGSSNDEAAESREDIKVVEWPDSVG